jgi:peptide/nickel transport system substrate-binding protein
MNLRRFLSIVSLLCLVFFSCHTHIEHDPSVLTWHMSSEPDTLNPLLATDVYASVINSFLYDSLIERNNETLQFEPKMAERWKISSDKKEFTFYLRKGLRWHDGKPVTVDDIIYSYDLIMNPKLETARLRVYYQEIEKVEKISDLVVRFTYKRPYFLALSFCGGIPILPKHLYEDGSPFNQHPQSRAPIGNGPYRFVEWQTNRYVHLQRNEDYWGKKPAIKTIEFKIIPDDTVALQVLKKGQLDRAGLSPLQWVRQSNSKKFLSRFTKYQYITPGYTFIAWNLRRPYFQDRRVRQALTHFVNRKDILERINYGLGKIVTGPFYSEGPDYNNQVKELDYDPDRGHQLLKEAGWSDHDGDGLLDKDGVKLSFEFLIPSGRRFYEQLSTILKEDLRKAGIEITIRRLEWALFTQKLNDRTFDAVTLGWSFGYEQDPYQVWHSSQSKQGSNFVGFNNKEVDQLIERGRKTYDNLTRNGYYHRIHSIIHEEQPYTFLFASPALVALNQRFKNVKVYPIGLDPLEWTLEE